MSVGAFMDLLERQGVVFDWREGALVIEASSDAISAVQRDELARRYDEVEALVRSAYVRWVPEPKASATPAQIAFPEAA